jgi:hypothetical protein
MTTLEDKQMRGREREAKARGSKNDEKNNGMTVEIEALTLKQRLITANQFVAFYWSVLYHH